MSFRISPGVFPCSVSRLTSRVTSMQGVQVAAWLRDVAAASLSALTERGPLDAEHQEAPDAGRDGEGRQDTAPHDALASGYSRPPSRRAPRPVASSYSARASSWNVAAREKRAWKSPPFTAQ